MGKRSSFARVPRDFYPTPFEAVAPLLPHLAPGTRYIEPCAGDGALIRVAQGLHANTHPLHDAGDKGRERNLSRSIALKPEQQFVCHDRNRGGSVSSFHEGSTNG